jgi:hypothetical protein
MKCVSLSEGLKNLDLSLLFLGNEKYGFVFIVKNESTKGSVLKMDMIQ